MSRDGVGPMAGPGNTDVLAALRSGRIRGEEARLRAATQLLEGLTYQELFKAMRDTIPEGGAIPGGTGQEMFEALLDQHVAQAAAMGSERGLGSAMYRHFIRASASPRHVGSDSSDAASVDTGHPDARV